MKASTNWRIRVLLGATTALMPVAALAQTQDIGGNLSWGVGAGQNVSTPGGVTIGSNTAIGSQGGIHFLRTGSNVTGSGNVGLGAGAGNTVVGADNVSLGTEAGWNINGNGNFSVGNSAGNYVTGSGNIALGGGAGGNITADNTVAIGSDAHAMTADGVALGTSSRVTGANSVAIGNGALADRNWSVSVGAVGAERQIVNVGAGIISGNSTDAVNGSQLYQTNVAVDQLGNRVTNVEGAVTNLGGRVTNVEGNVTNILNGTAGIVRQIGGAPGGGAITVGAETGGTVVSVAGTNGNRQVTGVANGAVNATSTDAVNGSQLFAVDGQITNLTTQIINGEIGLVQQIGGASAPITIGAQTGGTIINAAGTDGPRQITGVANGAVNAASTDAVNGAQLFAVDGRVTYVDDRVTNLTTQIVNGEIGLVQQIGGASAPITIGAQTGGTVVSVAGTDGDRQVTGVAPGTIAAGSTDAVNGDQLNTVSNVVDHLNRYYKVNSTGAEAAAGGLDAIAAGSSVSAAGDRSVAMGHGAFASVADSVALGSGSIAGAANGGWAGTTIGGVVMSNTLTANAVVSVSGNGVNRQITGVADGAVNAVSTDAVNGSQLFAALNALANSLPLAGDGQVVSAAPSAPVAPGSRPVGVPSTPSSSTPTIVNGGPNPPLVASGSGGLAIGYGATVSGANSVALGTGSNDGGRDDVVAVGSTGEERQIVNMAAGTAGTDGVNVSQLKPLIDSLGGGANIDATTGAVAGPTYNVGGASYTTVGDALSATNKLSVQYVPDAKGNPTNHVVLSGAGDGQGVRVSNVANGQVRSDAVNLGQLQDVQGQLSNRLDNLDNGLWALSGQVNRNRREARAGIAGTAAMANLPFRDTPGKVSMAAGVGGFKGTAALAAGLQYNLQDYPVRVRGSVAYTPNTNDVTWGAGVGWEF